MLSIGSMVLKWIHDHEVTPLSDERYLGPDFGASATLVQVADDQGRLVRTLVGYDVATNTIMEPGPGVLIPAPRLLTMYDSVTWQAIPAYAELVAGYVNGASSRWPAAAWAKFSKAQQIRIDVIGNLPLESDYLDIETGDARPQDAPAWIDARIAAGIKHHGLYCNTSTIAAVRAAVGRRPFDWWAAHYTGVAHLEPGSVATQWTDPASGSGGNYDLSLCAAEFPF